MTVLYSVREFLRRFFARFSGVLTICGRFLLAVFAFLFINREIGVSPIFTNLFVVLIFALIASITSTKVMVMLASVIILGNAYAIGYDILGLTALIMLLLLLVFVWFVPDDAVETILMPLALAVGVPALIPIICGLKRNPASSAAMVPGVIMHYYITTLGANIPQLRSMELSEFLGRLRIISEAFLGNRMMVMDSLAVVAVVVIVYAIRKLDADYSFEIAVAAGAVMYVVMALLGNYALDLGLSVGTVVLSALISAAVAFIFLFFVFRVDYSRSENLTFEDDDYYYYVKAIPKAVFSEEDMQARAARRQKGKGAEESGGTAEGDGGTL